MRFWQTRPRGQQQPPEPGTALRPQTKLLSPESAHPACHRPCGRLEAPPARSRAAPAGSREQLTLGRQLRRKCPAPPQECSLAALPPPLQGRRRLCYKGLLSLWPGDPKLTREPGGGGGVASGRAGPSRCRAPPPPAPQARPLSRSRPPGRRARRWGGCGHASLRTGCKHSFSDPCLPTVRLRPERSPGVSEEVETCLVPGGGYTGYLFLKTHQTAHFGYTHSTVCNSHFQNTESKNSHYL